MSDPVLDVGELLGLARDRRLSSLFGAPRDQSVLLVELGDAHDADAAHELATTDLGTLPAALIGIGSTSHDGYS